MIKVSVFVLALQLSIAVGVAAPQERRVDHVLDVTAVPTTQDTDSSSRGAGAGSGSGSGSGSGGPSGSSVPRPSKPSVSVTISSLDRVSYDTGDPVVLEMRVENVGKVPVDIPWSPDAAGFRTRTADGQRIVQGAVALEALDPVDKKSLAIFRVQPLFGASDAPNSLLRLPPGQTALIRARIFVQASDEELRAIDVVNSKHGNVAVRALLYLNDPGLVARSDNVEVMAVRYIRR